MKKIKLTQGKFALVDNEDFEWLNQWKWYFRNGYAVRGIWNNDKKNMDTIRMHRIIIRAPENSQVDHVDGNKLDNRRVNLRLCSPLQNKRNQKLYKNNKSGFKGVSLHVDNPYKRWVAQIRVEGKLLHLGYFLDKYLASQTYQKAARKYFGVFMRN